MRSLFLSLVIFLLMGSIITSCTSDDTILNDSSERVSIDECRKAGAREIGEKLLNSFGMIGTRSLSDNEYPDYYGGGYINDDGKLVVFVKGDFSKNKSILANSIGDYDNIMYVSGDYSYKELKGIISDITEFIDKNRENDIAKNIRYYYLNDFENNVVVELDRYSDGEIEEFKDNVVNSTAIVFKKCERTFQSHASLSPGNSIGTNKNGPLVPASMGYRAIRFGTIGFVTAGHAYNTNSNVYSSNGQIIGYCQYSIKAGSADAAFVIVTDLSYTLNNGVLTGEERNIWAGDLITKLGQTTGKTDGQIVSTSVNVNSEGVFLTDMAEATYLSGGGDSGGAVYLSGSNKLVGIHQGGATFNAIFTKISNVSSALNATFY